MKSGNLNLLEPSGPVQACYRIALPLLTITSAALKKTEYTVDLIFKISTQWGFTTG